MTRKAQKKELKRIVVFMKKHFPVIDSFGVRVQFGGQNKFGAILFSNN